LEDAELKSAMIRVEWYENALSKKNSSQVLEILWKMQSAKVLWKLSGKSHLPFDSA